MKKPRQHTQSVGMDKPHGSEHHRKEWIYMKKLSDVEQKLIQVITSQEGETVRDIAISITGAINPSAGVGTSVANSFLKQYNDYKIKLLLTGLSGKLNIEKQINELYNFVASSAERAIAVANLFKQTINADCPKVCVIYGIILSEHIGEKTDFTHEELILCKALENATDYDVCNFKEMMKNHVRVNAEGKRTVAYLEIEPKQQEKYIITCDWAVYNRIFKEENAEFGDIDDEGYSSMLTGTFYIVTEIADLLFEKIEDVQQIWKYDN